MFTIGHKSNYCRSQINTDVVVMAAISRFYTARFLCRREFSKSSEARDIIYLKHRFESSEVAAVSVTSSAYWRYIFAIAGVSI